MKVLFIGGTGNLSGDCTTRALGKGMEVRHLNRGRKDPELDASIDAILAAWGRKGF